MNDFDVDLTIIGAGVSGLRSAMKLQSQFNEIRLLEKTNQVGGRVKTFEQEGFLLDRGFQILLTQYPEIKKAIDLNTIDPQPFTKGAYIRTSGQTGSFSAVIDPLSHPIEASKTVFNQVGTITDKWKLFRLGRSLQSESIQNIFSGNKKSTLQYLRDFGFSEQIIEQFFRPFYAGVFLEGDLVTSSRMFEFVFKMFFEGQAVLPLNGIQAIPKRMEKQLDSVDIKFNRKVEAIEDQKVVLEGGESFRSEIIIDATSNNSLTSFNSDSSEMNWHGTNCYYFKLTDPPTTNPILYINALDGFINNLCFPSLVSSNYSPPGKHLLSVSTLQNERETVGKIKNELLDWFGPETKNWEFIGRYEIDQALPPFTSPDQSKIKRDHKLREGLFKIGDISRNPSLNGALATGRTVARRIQKEMKS